MGTSDNCVKAVLAWGELFVIFSLVFLSLSFATDNWVEYTVDRNELKTTSPTFHEQSKSDLAKGKIAHNRNVGLFRSCWPGNDTAFLHNAEGLVDNFCFERSFSMPEKAGTEYSNNFKTRIHLIRCWLSFMIIAIAALIVAFIIGLVTCCWITMKRAGVAATIAFCGAFLAAASMAFFHGAYYLERSKISDSIEFELEWDAGLRNATTRSYGWSYILGWVGVATTVIAAIIFLVIAQMVKSDDDKENELIQEKYRPDLAAPGYYDYYNPGYPAPYPNSPYIVELGSQSLPRGQRAIAYGPQDQQWSWS